MYVDETPIEDLRLAACVDQLEALELDMIQAEEEGTLTEEELTYKCFLGVDRIYKTHSGLK